jgi:hypothetical protein
MDDSVWSRMCGLDPAALSQRYALQNQSRSHSRPHDAKVALDVRVTLGKDEGAYAARAVTKEAKMDEWLHKTVVDPWTYLFREWPGLFRKEITLRPISYGFDATYQKKEEQGMFDPNPDFLWYLASPYSDDDPSVREDRFVDASEAAAHLMRAGLRVFCPIAMSHPMAEHGPVPPMGEVWYGFDNTILDRCDGLIVLMLRGWSTSRGVMAEVDRMVKAGKPVALMRVDSLLYDLRALTGGEPHARTIGRE